MNEITSTMIVNVRKVGTNPLYGPTFEVWTRNHDYLTSATSKQVVEFIASLIRKYAGEKWYRTDSNGAIVAAVKYTVAVKHI